MLLSSLFDHRAPAPKFAPWLFVGLIFAFCVVGQSRPLLGMVGLGTTLLIAGTLVELNRERIWEMYLKSYKKRPKPKSLWTKPNPIYYTLNVVFVWPFVIILGVACLWAAYVLS